MKKIRINKEMDLAKIYNVPPPSPEKGYELVYKFIPREKPKYFSKEEHGINMQDLKTGMKRKEKLSLFTRTQKIGYILIYFSLIGGLVLVSALIVYMLILKPHMLLYIP